MEKILETLGVPGIIIVVLATIWVILQFIGELCEVKGKIVPEWMKIRKFFKRRKAQEAERLETLKDVQALLASVNQHYNEDNIRKRDSWMQAVNADRQYMHERAEVYDASIEELKTEFARNRKMAEFLFVQNCRTTILDFATKIAREDYITTKDEFRRVFKVHENYEKFLEDIGEQNGEIDDAMEIIHAEYRDCLRTNKFLEPKRFQ